MLQITCIVSQLVFFKCLLLNEVILANMLYLSRHIIVNFQLSRGNYKISLTIKNKLRFYDVNTNFNPFLLSLNAELSLEKNNKPIIVSDLINKKC